MLSVYPGMSLDINFSQAVPGYPRGGVAPAPHASYPVQPYSTKGIVEPQDLFAGIALPATTAGPVSPALIDHPSSFGFAVTSAGATHAAYPTYMSPPFVQQPHQSRTLASGPMPTAVYSTAPFDLRQTSPVQVSAGTPPMPMHDERALPRTVLTTQEAYLREAQPQPLQEESGLPVDLCRYNSNSSNATAANNSSNSNNNIGSSPQLAGPAAGTAFSPEFPTGYHPYMFSGNVLILLEWSPFRLHTQAGPLMAPSPTKPMLAGSSSSENKRVDSTSPVFCSPSRQQHYQTTMQSYPYKRRSSGATSRSSSPTSDSSTLQNMMATFNTKVSSTTPKRYKCSVCFKKFTRPSSLTTHMYSHTGEVNKINRKMYKMYTIS